MQHPKYTLVYRNGYNENKYVIIEHTTAFGGIASRDLLNFYTFEQALEYLNSIDDINNGSGIVLAVSKTMADSKFEV